MKKSILLIALCGTASGLLCGHLAKKSTAAKAVFTTPTSLLSKNRATLASQDMPAIIGDISYPRSTDTLETLLAADISSRYARTAAWLADATEPEIAKFWVAALETEPSDSITCLIFTQWTRLDPSAALTAAGEKHAADAWRGWASHSPQAALAAAFAAGESSVITVARAIGRFHPAWLRAHLDQLPEYARRGAIESMFGSADTSDPLAHLKFMRENDMPFDPSTFKVLVEKDPWAAFDWLVENPALQAINHQNESSALDLLLDNMSRDRPEDLQRLADQALPGQLKRRMEASLFSQLLTTDPAAALAQARATDVPFIAAERLAKIGTLLAKSDPAEALQIAKEILERNPKTLRAETSIDYDRGGISWSQGDDTANDFIESLIHTDPGGLFDIAAIAGKTTTSTSGVFNSLIYKWAQHDLAGYTAWVNQQEDLIVRDAAVNGIVNSLVNKAHFQEAAEWVMSTTNPANSAHSLFYSWKKAAPAEAAAWIESDAVPAAMKPKFRQHIR